MKNLTISALTVFSAFAFIAPASAATLGGDIVGTLDLGGTVELDENLTSVTLQDFIFGLDNTSTIGIASDGVFEDFDPPAFITAGVAPVTVTGNTVQLPIANFLDLGLQDGVDVFNLAAISPIGGNVAPGIAESSNSVTFNFDLLGEFDVNGTEYLGEGTFTANYTLGNFADFQADLANEGVEVVYSMDFKAKEKEAVPEPASLLGLLAFAGLGIASKKRRQA